MPNTTVELGTHAVTFLAVVTVDSDIPLDTEDARWAVKYTLDNSAIRVELDELLETTWATLRVPRVDNVADMADLIQLFANARCRAQHTKDVLDHQDADDHGSDIATELRHMLGITCQETGHGHPSKDNPGEAAPETTEGAT